MKTKSDYLNKIEVWWLLRGMHEGSRKTSNISWGENGSAGSVSCEVVLDTDFPYVRLFYVATERGGKEQKLDYRISLIKTPCQFGGYRYWFKCLLSPHGKTCERRVGVLYMDGIYFGCRHCYQLTYVSRTQNRRYRNFPLFRAFDLSTKAQELQQKRKRRTWRGVETKKEKRLQKIYDELSLYHGKL